MLDSAKSSLLTAFGSIRPRDVADLLVAVEPVLTDLGGSSVRWPSPSMHEVLEATSEIVALMRGPAKEIVQINHARSAAESMWVQYVAALSSVSEEVRGSCNDELLATLVNDRDDACEEAQRLTQALEVAMGVFDEVHRSLLRVQASIAEKGLSVSRDASQMERGTLDDATSIVQRIDSAVDMADQEVDSINTAVREGIMTFCNACSSGEHLEAGLSAFVALLNGTCRDRAIQALQNLGMAMDMVADMLSGLRHLDVATRLDYFAMAARQMKEAKTSELQAAQEAVKTAHRQLTLAKRQVEDAETRRHSRRLPRQ
mmetsp:Transcript_22838/g.73813  ORF Transcript_22838/g.73813 Transcript_22838/m.73813 type:complete len:315 (+) Transcript_22838:565-1509(+)